MLAPDKCHDNPCSDPCPAAHPEPGEVKPQVEALNWHMQLVRCMRTASAAYQVEQETGCGSGIKGGYACSTWLRQALQDSGKGVGGCGKRVGGGGRKKKSKKEGQTASIRLSAFEVRAAWGGKHQGLGGERRGYLGGFVASLRDQVLGLVALVKDDEAVKGWGGPVQQLAQAGVPPVAAAGQAGVGQEDHTLLDTHLQPHTHLAHTQPGRKEKERLCRWAQFHISFPLA